jgi:hypothetical protein
VARALVRSIDAQHLARPADTITMPLPTIDAVIEREGHGGA